MWREEVTTGVLTAVCCLLLSSSMAADSSADNSGASPGTLSSTGEEPARILIYKQLLNKYVVEGMDVVIKYSIYNVGSVYAKEVQLKDASFGPDFEVVSGKTDVTYARILPNTNVTHTLVVRPIKFGYYNFTAAQVTYKSSETPEV
jgi:translocon-associated protein subunit beta